MEDTERGGAGPLSRERSSGPSGRAENIEETPHDPRVALGPDGPCFTRGYSPWPRWGRRRRAEGRIAELGADNGLEPGTPRLRLGLGSGGAGGVVRQLPGYVGSPPFAARRTGHPLKKPSAISFQQSAGGEAAGGRVRSCQLSVISDQWPVVSDQPQVVRGRSLGSGRSRTVRCLASGGRD